MFVFSISLIVIMISTINSHPFNSRAAEFVHLKPKSKHLGYVHLADKGAIFKLGKKRISQLCCWYKLFFI